MLDFNIFNRAGWPKEQGPSSITRYDVKDLTVDSEDNSFDVLKADGVIRFKGVAATDGQPAMMSANRMIQSATSGVAPIGFIAKYNSETSEAIVVTKGLFKIPYSGSTSPSLGMNHVVANGSGGIRIAGSDETGKECLVVMLNTSLKYAVCVF